MKDSLGFEFYALPKSLTARRDLELSDKIVVSVIRDYQGTNGTGWPGIRTLSQDTGLASSTIIESIKRLEAKEILKVERRGNGKSSHYIVSKSALNIGTVKKQKRTGDPNGHKAKAHRRPNTSAPIIGAQAHRPSEPNQKDLVNQTHSVGALFTFPLKNGQTWELPAGKLAEYQDTFSHLDADGELRKARQWLSDNPDRQKTDRGMIRFLGGWLGRAKPGGNGEALPPEKSEAEIEAAFQEMRL